MIQTTNRMYGFHGVAANALGDDKFNENAPCEKAATLFHVAAEYLVGLGLAEKKAASTPLQNAVRYMTLEQAMRVYAVASAKERTELAPLIAQKRARETLPAFQFQ